MKNRNNILYLYLLLLLSIVFIPCYAQEAESKTTHIPNTSEPSHLIKVQKEQSTAAVSSTTGNILQRNPAPNLHNTLHGLLPGLYISQDSGEPGYDGAWLTIRGLGSYNYGSYAVFVDGFQTNPTYIQYLTPGEIETISIFKDAASLATFGMKGANGVIWVETKRGRKGKPLLKMHVRYGTQHPVHITKPLNAYEYASLYNEAISNDRQRIWSPRYTESQLNDYKTGSSTNTDWYNEVVKSATPFLSTDANLSGGTDLAKYFILFNYTKTQGLYKVKTDDRHSNAQLQQFNIRSNFDFKLFNFIEGKVDLGGRVEDRRYPAYNGNSLWNNLERYPNNVYPVINPDGTWPGTSLHPDNPLASIRELGYHSTRDRSLQINFSLKQDLSTFTEGLYLMEAVSFSNWSRGTYNLTKNYARIINGTPQTTDQNTNYSIYDDWGTNQWRWLQFKTGVGYDKQIGKASLNSALSYLQQTYGVDANQNNQADINTEYAFQNISGRFNYAYDKKYIGEFGFSISGSDNYAKGNRFGFYPSLSAAWIVSNEDFVNRQRLKFLKLRGSLGVSAYDGFIGRRYLYEQYYTWSGSYPTGNGTPTWHGGIVPAYTANPHIFAEKSMKYNIGIDATLFNTLVFTADAFLDKRSGIISQDFNHMSDAFGTEAPFANLGKVTTSGFEANINYSNSINSLKYSLGANVSYYTDKIDYMAEDMPASSLAWRTGNSIGARFGYEAIGFYNMDDFDPQGNLKTGIPVPSFGKIQPGDIRYRDLNDDKIINEKDILKIGTSDHPNLIYAITAEAAYKAFDFRVLFQGAASRQLNILTQARNKIVAFENNGNAYPIAKGRWAYYPEQGIDTREKATYPRLSTQNNNNNYQNSSFWIKKADFLRLRNIELGYTFDKKYLSKLRMENARLYLTAINLFTWSALLKEYDIDPETPTGYPFVKSYNLGLSIEF